MNRFVVPFLAFSVFFGACVSGPSDRVVRTDVLVIGAGGAGLVAAVEAAALGAKVYVIDKSNTPGGDTLLAGSGMDAVGTKWQQTSHIDYDSTAYAEELYAFGGSKGTKTLLSIFSTQSGSAMQFLETCGLKLRLSDPLGHPKRHQAEVGGTGAEVIKVLAEAARARGVTIETNLTATELVSDSRGRVTGVKATDANKREVFLNAKATILATGGFAANSQMVSEYATEWRDAGTDLASRSATGDGVRLARAIGADIVSMNYVVAFPTVSAKGAPIRGLESAGAILVNRLGRRFINETADATTVAQAILGQEGKMAYILFGGELAKGNPASVKALSDAGILETGDRLADLSARLSVSSQSLKATLDEYNAAVARHADTRFQRSFLPLPIRQSRFFAVAVHPAVYATLGGVRIDGNAQMSRGGSPIPGLYAAGEVTGGIFGANAPSTVTVTSSVVFGRIAAQSAVRQAKQR